MQSPLATWRMVVTLPGPWDPEERAGLAGRSRAPCFSFCFLPSARAQAGQRSLWAGGAVRSGAGSVPPPPSPPHRLQLDG